MLESRNCYGYTNETTRTRTPDELEKWRIAYRTNDGGYGIVGWLCLFDSYEEAQKQGEKIKNDRPWIKEIIIQHPSKYESMY